MLNYCSGSNGQKMLPDDWEDHFKRLYTRTVEVLLTAGCDRAQARSIAQERVLETAQRMVGPNVVVVDYRLTDGENR